MSLHGSPAPAAAAAAPVTSLLQDLAAAYDRSQELCWVLLFIFPSAGIHALTRYSVMKMAVARHKRGKKKKKGAAEVQLCR